MNRQTSELEAALGFSQRRLKAYQLLSFFLIFVCGVLFYRLNQKQTNPSTEKISTKNSIDPAAPFHEEVKAIVEPLTYSFLPILSQPEARLSLDFKRNIWVLHNIHFFDEKGHVSLQDNRYGLCGDLAAYTYQKIAPLMEVDYKVRFVRAAESHFFPAPLNSHFVLSIIRRSNPKEIYILDPSFKRYGPIDQFDDYLFFEQLPTLDFMARKLKNHVEIVNRAAPVLIQSNIKLSLIVIPENDRFDEQNFSIAIMGTNKGMYMPRIIYKVGLNAGKREIVERREEAETLKDVEEYRRLIGVVNKFFDQLTLSKNTPSAATKL